MKIFKKDDWIRCTWKCEGLTIGKDYKVLDFIPDTGVGGMVSIINDRGQMEAYFIMRFKFDIRKQRKQKLNELHKSTI